MRGPGNLGVGVELRLDPLHVLDAVHARHMSLRGQSVSTCYDVSSACLEGALAIREWLGVENIRQWELLLVRISSNTTYVSHTYIITSCRGLETLVRLELRGRKLKCHLSQALPLITVLLHRSSMQSRYFPACHTSWPSSSSSPMSSAAPQAV